MKRTTEPMRDIEAYLRPDQIKRMIDHAGRGRKGMRNRLLLLMLAYTGRRIGEILRVKVCDIIEDENQINFNILKKRRPLRRIKPVPPDLIVHILEYTKTHNLRPHDYLFYSPWDISRPLSDARCRQIVYDLAVKANVPDFANGHHPHPHTFRHSFAVEVSKNMREPGDIVKLQKMLDHSDIIITSFYLQYNDKDQRNIINNLYK